MVLYTVKLYHFYAAMYIINKTMMYFVLYSYIIYAIMMKRYEVNFCPSLHHLLFDVLWPFLYLIFSFYSGDTMIQEWTSQLQ